MSALAIPASMNLPQKLTNYYTPAVRPLNSSVHPITGAPLAGTGVSAPKPLSTTGRGYAPPAKLNVVSTLLKRVTMQLPVVQKPLTTKGPAVVKTVSGKTVAVHPVTWKKLAGQEPIAPHVVQKQAPHLSVSQVIPHTVTKTPVVSYKVTPSTKVTNHTLIFVVMAVIIAVAGYFYWEV